MSIIDEPDTIRNEATDNGLLMTDNRTPELREKLDDLIIELDRLDTTLDLPASDMTVGEYEQEREKLLDGFIQAVAVTQESGTLTAEQVREAIRKYAEDDSCYIFEVYGEMCGLIADELNAKLGNKCAKCLKDIDVDEVYIEKIKPRLIKGTPTEDIRRWSILAHSVMEITGPSTFGTDGNVFLWLHENSLTQLLDMCDAVDERFAELGCGTCENVDILANIGCFKCSKCGISDNYVPNYCPNCGAKVLENKK